MQEEIGYRKLKIAAKHVLEDTRKACNTLAERDLTSEEFKHLQLGIKNFTNFTIDRFAIEEAITAAAKAAYLTTLLNKKEHKQIETFKSPLEMRLVNRSSQELLLFLLCNRAATLQIHEIGASATETA